MNKNVTDVIKYNSNSSYSVSDNKSEHPNTTYEAFIRRIKSNRSYENRNSAQILEELLF